MIQKGSVYKPTKGRNKANILRKVEHIQSARVEFWEHELAGLTDRAPHDLFTLVRTVRVDFPPHDPRFHKTEYFVYSYFEGRHRKV